MSLHPVVSAVTARIAQRSAPTRARYLEQVRAAAERGRVARAELACTNLAHGFAASEPVSKLRLKLMEAPNLAIVSAYNDMLSAHQPLAGYPRWIKEAAQAAGASAQFAGGVPAMCDGVTQGRPGMELSLFSRDVIAQASAVALSHAMFDAALYLGVCDKIVPGLLMGALAFGHLPAVFVPAGPMPSGLSNDEKAEVRKLYAQGLVGRDVLLESEAQSYHAPGTCTFYGTANSNQLMMEAMGLHLPGAAFVPPGTPLREALTREAARVAVEISAQGPRFTPVGELVDERAIVNAVVVLLASGGSTNHTLHLPAIARMAGIALDWDDFAELSAVVPSLMRVYPNGKADVNHFHAAGGCGFLLRELMDAGLLHPDVSTVSGHGLARQCRSPALDADCRLVWHDAIAASADSAVLRGAASPFAADGGLRVVTGRLGRAVVKVSAVPPERRRVTAPARVFDSQDALLAAFKGGALTGDMVAVVRSQGPRANGMPELHQLTPTLSVLQDRGHAVALVSDGRMSGASGKVLAAIHVCPEAADGGALSRVRDGDLITVDADAGVLDVDVAPDEWAARAPAPVAPSDFGCGRELFAGARQNAGRADLGALSFPHPLWN